MIIQILMSGRCIYLHWSPIIREKYQKRLEKFFDFTGLEVEISKKKACKPKYYDGISITE